MKKKPGVYKNFVFIMEVYISLMKSSSLVHNNDKSSLVLLTKSNDKLMQSKNDPDRSSV